MIDINSFLIDDNINLIEIYLTEKNIINNDICIDVSVGDIFVDNIINKYKNFKNKSFKCYHRHNLNYIYDLTNDYQTVLSKRSYDVKTINNINICSYNESKYPSYMFPCLNDIDYICEYTIMEYKFTNRLSINIRKDIDNINSVYIEYKHNLNVELDKINNIINNIIKK